MGIMAAKGRTLVLNRFHVHITALPYQSASLLLQTASFRAQIVTLDGPGRLPAGFPRNNESHVAEIQASVSGKRVHVQPPGLGTHPRRRSRVFLAV